MQGSALGQELRLPSWRRSPRGPHGAAPRRLLLVLVAAAPRLGAAVVRAGFLAADGRGPGALPVEPTAAPDPADISRVTKVQRDKDVLELAKQEIASLPSYCESVSGVPYASALRARGIASLARLHLVNYELRTPSDPLEWSCSHPWSAWFMYGLVFWAGMTMAAFIYASFWHRGKIPRFDQNSSLDPEATFNSSHFGCLSEPNSCLCAFVFPAVQWADTMHMAGILSFWLAFWLMAVCQLPALLFGAFGFVLVAPLVFYRQRLREKLGVASGNETYVTDCFYATFCSCCLISQEARVINEAYVIGHSLVPVSGGRPD